MRDAYLAPQGGLPPLADAVTVNPYLGRDGIDPFVRAAAAHGGGVFVLVKTSNPSSADYQDRDAGGRKVFEIVADDVEAMSRATAGPTDTASSARSPARLIPKSSAPAQAHAERVAPRARLRRARRRRPRGRAGVRRGRLRAPSNASRTLNYPWGEKLAGAGRLARRGSATAMMRMRDELLRARDERRGAGVMDPDADEAERLRRPSRCLGSRPRSARSIRSSTRTATTRGADREAAFARNVLGIGSGAPRPRPRVRRRPAPRRVRAARHRRPSASTSRTRCSHRARARGLVASSARTCARCRSRSARLRPCDVLLHVVRVLRDARKRTCRCCAKRPGCCAPGGRLLLDVPDRDALERGLVPKSEFQREGLRDALRARDRPRPGAQEGDGHERRGRGSRALRGVGPGLHASPSSSAARSRRGFRPLRRSRRLRRPADRAGRALPRRGGAKTHEARARRTSRAVRASAERDPEAMDASPGSASTTPSGPTSTACAAPPPAPTERRARSGRRDPRARERAAANPRTARCARTSRDRTRSS